MDLVISTLSPLIIQTSLSSSLTIFWSFFISYTELPEPCNTASSGYLAAVRLSSYSQVSTQIVQERASGHSIEVEHYSKHTQVTTPNMEVIRTMMTNMPIHPFRQYGASDAGYSTMPHHV